VRRGSNTCFTFYIFGDPPGRDRPLGQPVRTGDRRRRRPPDVYPALVRASDDRQRQALRAYAALLKERPAPHRRSGSRRPASPTWGQRPVPVPHRGWLPALQGRPPDGARCPGGPQCREVIAHQVWTAKRTGTLSTIGVRDVHLCRGMVGQLPYWSGRIAATALSCTVGVRIGLPTGLGQLYGGGYVGIDLHRAARIADAGHGGQILLSDVTRALVGSRLPANLSLLDLGPHRLKDLAHPERLYQLAVEELPSKFPPLRSRDAGRTIAS
jgi:hypothetical protein